MAWNKESKAARRARVAKQLRDKHGKWIEMGGGVKWFNNGSWHNGTASAFEGSNVVVTMDDGSEQRVNHRQIEPIRAKGSLGAKPAKPTGSVQAKKSPGKRGAESTRIKDNDPGKRLTTNAADLEEGDEVYQIGASNDNYSVDDVSAAGMEDKGFELFHNPGTGEPARARVVDTSGDSVVVEDSRGKRHEIPKAQNVIADDPEVDAALLNKGDDDSVPADAEDFDVKSVNAKDLNIPAGATDAYKKGMAASKGKNPETAEDNFMAKNGREFADEFTMGLSDGVRVRDGDYDRFQSLFHKYAQKKNRDEGSGRTLGDTLPEEMRAMPVGTELHAPGGTSFRKDGADAWQRVDSQGKDVGKPATSTFLQQNLDSKDAKFLTKNEAAAKNADRPTSGEATPQGEEVTLDAPKAKIAPKESVKKDDEAFEGLGLSDEEKAHINAAETGAEALKRLAESDAGDAYRDARTVPSESSKKFVADYRKASKALSDKYEGAEKKEEAPAQEAPKSDGTPPEVVAKSVESLSEDLEEIDSKSMDAEAEAAALKEAVYDFKGDDGEVFNLSGSRDEDGNWQLDVTDSDGQHVTSINPATAGGPQKLAKAIKDSTKDDSSADSSEAPTEAPETPKKPRTLRDRLNERNPDSVEAEAPKNEVPEKPTDTPKTPSEGAPRTLKDRFKEMYPERFNDENDQASEKPEEPEAEAQEAEATTGDTSNDVVSENVGSEATRDALKYIVTDAFENNNSETMSIDVGNGKSLEVTKGLKAGDMSKVDGLTVKLRDTANVGNTSMTTDQFGNRSISRGADEAKIDGVVDELVATTQHIEKNGQIHGSHSPEAKKYASEATAKRLEEGNKAIADRKAAEEEAKKAAEAPADSGEPGTREDLNKALKDAGFSDAEIDSIAKAAESNESEADKQFFDSEAGKSGNTNPDEKFKAARKALDDFMKENNESVKAAHKNSDDTRQDSADEKAQADELDTPEAIARGAKETIDSGKQRDEDRAAKNTDEAKLAELDRKIAVGEKMLADTEAKDNHPLAKRLMENLDALKKQRDALAPGEEESDEEASGFTVGAPFDVPEGGVAILSNKKLEKKTADFLKNGDHFFAHEDENGKLRPVIGNDLRVTPDGESYRVTGTKKTSDKTTVDTEDSTGKPHTFEFGVGDRKKNVVLDTEKNRKDLDLTNKSGESEPEESSESEESSTEPSSLSQPDVAKAMDELEAQIGKIKAKTMEATIAKVAPVELPNGNVLTMGLDKGSIAYEVQDKDGNTLGFASFMSGSQDKREQDILALANTAGDESSDIPETDTDVDAPEAATPEVDAPEETDKPKAEVTDDAIDGVMRGIEAQQSKLKTETTDELVSQLRGGSLTDGRSVNLVKDENGNLAWEAREKDGTPIGQVPFMDEKRFVDTEKRNAALRDLLNGKKEEESTAPASDEVAPEDADVPEAELEVPAEKDPEEEKLAEDFIAENPEETQDASEGPSPEEITSTVEEALSDIDDDLKEFGGESSWDDLKDRTWPINESEEGSQQYIAVGEGSSDDDRFLGRYDAETNEELETFDMEGNSTDGNSEDTDDTSRADDGGRDDSSGDEVPGGDQSDSGAGDGSSESGSRSVTPEEYAAPVQSFVDEVRDDPEGTLGKSLDTGDGYSVSWEEIQPGGRVMYRFRDPDGNLMVQFAKKRDRDLGLVLKRWQDSHKAMMDAYSSDPDTEGRDVVPNPTMMRISSIGTTFDRDDERYTRISPVAWGRGDRDGNISEVIEGISFSENQEGDTYRLGHTDDNHRPDSEINAMDDDELRQNLKDFEDRIKGIIERDGKIGDHGNLGLPTTRDDNDQMSLLRFQALSLHEESKAYSQALWNRLRETGGHSDNGIDIGDFDASQDVPYTNKSKGISEASWARVRNEYVGLDHRTVGYNYELRNSDKPSRAALAWATKMDKWSGSGELADDFVVFRSVLASPDAATEFQAGNTVTDKGVMSVADNEHTAEVYLGNRSVRTAGKIPVMMEIEARKGEKMTAAGQGSDELVVPRGAKLFIASAHMDNDGILRVVARLNPSDAEVAEWTNKSTSDAPSAPETAPEAPEVSPEPSTPAGLPEAADPEAPVNGEEGFTPVDGGPKEGRGKFTQVEGFENGDRVFHGKHGAGTIVKRENNGQFARIQFDKDKDSGKVMGISLTKVTKGETAAPEAEAPKSPAKTISPRPTTVKEGSTAETGEWKNGERVNHGKHGAGTIKRLEGNGEYARVEFDGAAGTKGIKLTQLGRGDDTPAPSKPETDTKVKTPKVPKAPLASAPEGSPGQVGGWSLGDSLIHKSKGSGTLKSFGKDGTFGMVEFDNEPGVQRGIRFSGLSKSDSTTPSQIADPPTIVDGPNGQPINSGDTDTRTAGKDPSTASPVEDKNGAEFYIGAVVVHPQLGRGSVVKIGTGKNKSIQVIFDNDPSGTPKSLSGARLQDIAIAPKGAADKTAISK